MLERAGTTETKHGEQDGMARARNQRSATDRTIDSDGYEAIDKRRMDPSTDLCPVIRAFMEAWREGLPETERAILVPLVATIARSRATPDVERRRGLMAADWLIRTCAPVWLSLAGLNQHACLLYGLPEITDMAQAVALRGLLARVSHQVYAEAAGIDEAGWIKASDECWASAWAGAFDAARLAADDPAWISAAAAVRAAAGLAARSSNHSFIAALQMTAAKLVVRMASVGRSPMAEDVPALPLVRHPRWLENPARILPFHSTM